MKPSIKRILFPTDFSAASQRAKDYACAIAGPPEAELHVLHVIAEPLPIPDPNGSWLNPQKTLISQNIEDAKLKLADQLKESGIRDRSVIRGIRLGQPVEEIMKYAEEHNIDLIVMGTHGRTGLSHLLIGSVAEKIIRLSKCPVLTVHP